MASWGFLANHARVLLGIAHDPAYGGVTDPGASLAAEAGIAVFRIAFERWISDPSQPDLPQLIRESLDELKAVTAGK